MQSYLYVLQRESEFIVAGEKSFNEYIENIKNKSIEIGKVDEKYKNRELNRLDDRIQELKEKIRVLKLQHRDVQAIRAEVSKDMNCLRLCKDAMLDRCNKLRKESTNLQDEIISIDEEQERVTSSLTKYKQINGLNDAFYIWYAGPYATINTFRLGTIPNKNIEWTEINSALGQAALAMSTIASKAGFEFKHYNIVPMGSFPKIYKSDDKRTTLNLYYDPNAFALFPKQYFNKALVGFVSCVEEFGDYIANVDPTLSLPCKISISECKIGGLSFTYGTDEEIWTRALKYLLANMKWIIAWYGKYCCTYITNTPLYRIK